jgi:hypothetical protein
MKGGRSLTTLGSLLVLLGLLTSPVKQVALRCWSNPAGWLETQCDAFRELHWPLGYVPLVLGIVMIVASLALRNESKND